MADKVIDKSIKRCPTWAWIVMIILALIIFYQYRNSVSLDEYTSCVADFGASVKNYAELGIDWLDLLNCYQRDLPYCLPPIQRGGSASVFKQYSHGNCGDLYPETSGLVWCCPEPNMRVVDNSCVSNWENTE